jgi:uncharacterized protein (TIGR00369 family)
MIKHTPAHGHTDDPNTKSPQNHCFACGKDNADGMHLKFFLDEQGRQAICEFSLEQRYQGPPGHAHGGIIATILDEAMGKVNKLSNVVALTKNMSIDYLKPVPLGAALTVTGREQKIEGRLHTNVAEISNAKGEILARSTGTFVAVDIGKMFNKFIG